MALPSGELERYQLIPGAAGWSSHEIAGALGVTCPSPTRSAMCMAAAEVSRTSTPTCAERSNLAISWHPPAVAPTTPCPGPADRADLGLAPPAGYVLASFGRA
jgi:hypothetical protein